MNHKPSLVQGAVLSALAMQPAAWQSGPRRADYYVMLDGTAFGANTLYGLQVRGWVRISDGAVHITDAGRAALTEWRSGILRAFGRTPEGYHPDGRKNHP
jgi:hypothetical protein